MKIHTTLKPILGVIIFISSTVLAAAGGISGGGGEVICPDRPTYYQDPEHIKDVIEQSKSKLVSYIDYKKKQLLSDELEHSEKEIIQKIFEPNKMNIHEAVNRFSVYIDDDHPCYTSDRQPVDGSIYSKKPNSICISSATIARKVHFNQVSKQSTALMLHEYSEVVGLTEAEAVTLQKKALEEIPQ